MNIILLIHQEDSLGYSMQRYANTLKSGLSKKGHKVNIVGPKLYLSKLSKQSSLKKWLKYIDQYLIFPINFHFQKQKYNNTQTLYVLLDQALGIWTPLINKKKHIIHCHDFIALKSAQGNIIENKISLTGKLYQKLILKGFSKSDNFISISKNTQIELNSFLKNKPIINEQIYNAIENCFTINYKNDPKIVISNTINRKLPNGYLLHVGGNTFYKNRNGVINIYEAWRNSSDKKLPLIMIGSAPTPEMLNLREHSKYKNDIYFLTKVQDSILISAYQGASLFLFPSILEGFGYPIIEAMACGCPVITTNTAPMNEIGGSAAIYIPIMTEKNKKLWPNSVAKKIEQFLNKPDEQVNMIKKKSLENSKRFDQKKFINDIEKVYLKAISN